jgi:hypothetical protein
MKNRTTPSAPYELFERYMAPAARPSQIGYLRIVSNKRAEQEETVGGRRLRGGHLTGPFHRGVEEGAPGHSSVLTKQTACKYSPDKVPRYVR